MALLGVNPGLRAESRQGCGACSRALTFSPDTPQVSFGSLWDIYFFCKGWVLCTRCFAASWTGKMPGHQRPRERGGSAAGSSPGGLWVCDRVSPCSRRPRGAPVPESQHLLPPRPLCLLSPWCPRDPGQFPRVPSSPRAPGCPSLGSRLLLSSRRPAAARDGLGNLSMPSAQVTHFLLPGNNALPFPL